MRPEFFDLQFTPSRFSFVADRPRQCEQFHPGGESLRDVAVRFRTDFTVPALGFHHAGQSDELAAGFGTHGLLYSMISSV
jgi:hypothetical protein